MMRKRRRLAAAGRTEQRHELAIAHIEIEIAERDRAALEHLADTAQRDDRLGRRLMSAEDVRLAGAASRSGSEGIAYVGRTGRVTLRAVGQFFGRRSTPTPLLTNCSV